MHFYEQIQKERKSATSFNREGQKFPSKNKFTALFPIRNIFSSPQID